MFVVLPVCHKDLWLAIKVLGWAIELDGKTQHDCLIVHDELCGIQDLEPIARDYFRDVKVAKVESWKGRRGQWVDANRMFQQATSHIYSKKPFGEQAFFWWEPDLTPLKRDWLGTLEKRHEQGRKAFTGHIVTGVPYENGVTYRWMTGCGIYPWDMFTRSYIVNTTLYHPWDVAGRDAMVPHCTEANDLIQHVWVRNGAPFHFVDLADAKQTLLPTAVTFHRCKDGSLIDVLQSDGTFTRAVKAVKDAVTAGVEAVKAAVMPEPAKESETAIVQLGRYGDILGVLPIAHEIARTEGVPPKFYTSSEFVGLLSGVSYVKPITVTTGWEDPQTVVEDAAKTHKRVIKTQCHGRGARDGEHFDSFMTLMWSNAGMAGRWHDLPLVFDNRNPRREKRLVRKHLKPEHRVGLCLSGLSSPVPEETQAALRAKLKEKFGDAVLDLSEVRAEQLYDMLGVLEKLDALVCSDTSILHLSYACKIPTVALVADTPRMWFGSRRRKHWVGDYRYSIVPLSLDSIVADVEWGMKHRAPRLIHFFSDYKGNADAERRKAVARAACAMEYPNGRWEVCPIPDSALPRMFQDDGRRLPYIHDLFAYAMNRARPDDILVFTNSDISLAPGATEKILKHFETFNAGYSFRRDFSRLDAPLRGEDEVLSGDLYSGSDLFAVRVGWWRYKKDWFPRFALGGESWDWCMRRYYDINHSQPAIIKDCIYHERHISPWEANKNCRINIESRQLARAFLSKLGDYHGEFEWQQ